MAELEYNLEVMHKIASEVDSLVEAYKEVALFDNCSELDRKKKEVRGSLNLARWRLIRIQLLDSFGSTFLKEENASGECYCTWQSLRKQETVGKNAKLNNFVTCNRR